MEEQATGDRHALLTQLQWFAQLALDEAGNEQYLHAFADDAVLLPPDRRAIRGRPAIRKFYDEVLHSVTQGRVVYDDASIDIKGTLAVRRYAGTAFLVYAHSTEPRVTRTKYLDVLRKRQDGAWQITVHMWSANDDFAPHE